MPTPHRLCWAGLSCLAATATCPERLTAAGFALQEHSVSGLGNAFAGGAASAEDASTVYFNPAGMARIGERQVHIGAHFIFPDAAFRNEGSTTLGRPTSGGDATSDESAILPNLFYVGPAGDDLAFGLGLSAPFGLATEYDADWVGRYLARETALETVALNPSVAYRVNGRLSLGGGISYVKSEATLSNAIDFGLVCLNQFQSGGVPVNEQTAALAGDIQANLGGTKYDGGIELTGEGDGWGVNFGALYEFSETLRVGAHYRSEVSLALKGDADFTVGALEGVLGAAFPDQGGRVDLDLPASLALSVYVDVSDRLALMADVTRTWWSSFEALRIQFDADSPPDSVLPEGWEDVSKYSVGASYRFNDKLTGRIGFAYDESPVPNDELRSPRIPDEDRIWATGGLSYRFSERVECHLSYLRIFIDDPKIDNGSHAAGQRLVGSIDASVHLLSVGSTIRF